MGSLGPETGGRRTKLYVTGFKKFHGVADNPTEVIVGRMKSYLDSCSKERVLPPGVSLESCTVLETAGDGARELLLSLLDSAIGGSLEVESEGCGVEESGIGVEGDPVGSVGREEKIVWLHLGVNSSAARFAIEQRAVNEATFRCADEMGWQPQRQPIVAEDGGLQFARETTFPVNSIVDALVKHGFDVATSFDAGRFVCNYLYYHSLRHAAAHGTRALFVHVPPFTVISEDTQMEFVTTLLKVLAVS